LCVNTLSAGQSAVAGLFATRDLAMEQRFAAAVWSRLATGAPVLEGAAASFDCRIVERLERGTHAVILCEVEAVKVSEDAGALVYFGRGYRTLGQED
jgi:flavin reductase